MGTLKSPGRVSRSCTGDHWLHEWLLVSRTEQRGRGISLRQGCSPLASDVRSKGGLPKLGLVPSLSQLAKPQEEERLTNGNPVFQSPPLCSLPRDPVQISTDLRYLVQSQNNNNPDSCMASIGSSSHFDVREGKEEARKKWLHFAFLV